jgi:hypothetical protein
MRTTLLAPTAAALLTAAAVAGCSSGPGQAQTLATVPAQTPATASSAPAPAADLSKALLALDDMPPGWSPQTVSSDSGGSPSCVPLKDGAWKHLPQSAEADFEQGQTGPFLIEQLAGGSASQAGAAMRALIKATGECAKFTQKTGSGTNAWSLEPLSFPSYGDATYAFALTIASDAGMSAGGDVVIVRKGGVLVQVTVYGIGSVSVSTVEDLVGKAVAKA